MAAGDFPVAVGPPGTLGTLSDSFPHPKKNNRSGDSLTWAACIPVRVQSAGGGAFPVVGDTMVSVPLVKIFSLTIKTLSKPVAKRIKSGEISKPVELGMLSTASVSCSLDMVERLWLVQPGQHGQFKGSEGVVYPQGSWGNRLPSSLALSHNYYTT